MTTTTDLAALQAVCRADTTDNTARLVLADCVEENGDSDRAEAIRLGLRLKTPPWNSKDMIRHANILARHQWDKCPCPECEGSGNLRAGETVVRGFECVVCGGTGDLFKRMRTDFHARTPDEWGRDLTGTTDPRVQFDRGFLVVEAEPGECWNLNEWGHSPNYRQVTPAPWLAALSRTEAWPWVVLRVRGLEPVAVDSGGKNKWFLSMDDCELLSRVSREDFTRSFDTLSAVQDAIGSALWTWADTHVRQ